MSSSKTKNIYLASNLQPPKVTRIKKGTRIEFINQDLEEAIKQMKQAIKNKSQFSLGISSGKPHTTNPEKHMENTQDIDKMFYTQTYKKKMEVRLSQIEERRKQLNTRSLEKQMKARLLRKIEENTELQQKMDVLKEVQQRRELLLIEKSQKQKRRKEEEQMLHESSLVNAEMFRKSKKKTLKTSLKESRCDLLESLKDLKFKSYLTQKQKQQKQVLLNSRLQFMIRNKSVPGLRGELTTSRSNRNSTINLNRPIKTSHQEGRTQRKSQKNEEEEDLIIKQYATKQNHHEGRTQSNEGQPKSQKKYNSMVRKKQESEKKEEKSSEREVDESPLEDEKMNGNQ